MNAQKEVTGTTLCVCVFRKVNKPEGPHVVELNKSRTERQILPYSLKRCAHRGRK